MVPVSHTEYAQGAWWQVDLGSKKNIKQIGLSTTLKAFNETEKICCNGTWFLFL
jgi:hypothetical protein